MFGLGYFVTDNDFIWNIDGQVHIRYQFYGPPGNILMGLVNVYTYNDTQSIYEHLGC